MRYLILILILFLGVVLFFSYPYFENKERPKELTLFGNVDVRQVDLGFQVPGRVIKMFFEEGDQVKGGTLIGLLDKQPYLDQVRQSEANVESAKATLHNATILLERRKELIQDGSVSKEDLDNASVAVEVNTANVKQVEAAMGIARTNLNYTELYAPNLGVILTRVREPGSVVNVGEPIYTETLTDPVWIRAFVQEPELGLIYPNMEAEIFTDTPGAKIYHGHIGFISPVAEFSPKTVETTHLRTNLVYRLRVIAENPDQGLRQGMPVTVKLRIPD